MVEATSSNPNDYEVRTFCAKKCATCLAAPFKIKLFFFPNMRILGNGFVEAAYFSVAPIKRFVGANPYKSVMCRGVCAGVIGQTAPINVLEPPLYCLCVVVMVSMCRDDKGYKPGFANSNPWP